MRNLSICRAMYVVVGSLLMNACVTPSSVIRYSESARLAPIKAESLRALTAPRKEITADDSARLLENLNGQAQATLRPVEGAERASKEHFLFGDQNDPSAALTVQRSGGGFVFSKGLRPYQVDGETPRLPTKESAVRVARAHLDKLGLTPPDGEMVVAHVGGLNMAVHRKDGTSADFPKLVTVRFDRRIDGIPVVGKSRVVMHLGEDGSLVGMVWDWMPVEGRPLRPEEILGVERLRPQIEQRIMSEVGKPQQVVVERQDLVLFDDGRGVIEPAIRVQAMRTYQAQMANGKDAGQMREYMVPYDAIVPLLVSPRAVYPHMRGAEEARRAIKGDRPEEPAPPGTNDDEPSAK